MNIHDSLRREKTILSQSQRTVEYTCCLATYSIHTYYSLSIHVESIIRLTKNNKMQDFFFI